MGRTLFVVSAVAVSLGVTACSKENRDAVGDKVQEVATDVQNKATDVAGAAAELAVRNVAAEAGTKQFADNGAPLDGGLSCEADSSQGIDKMSVSCTGTTTDGKAAALSGALNETPGASVTKIRGTFTGTVEGAQVFNVDQLGA